MTVLAVAGVGLIVLTVGDVALLHVTRSRYFWYKSWFMPNTTSFEYVLHLLPHWNWDAAVNASVDVWAFSNAHKVELFVNGACQVLVMHTAALCAIQLDSTVVVIRAWSRTPLTLIPNGQM